MGKYKDNMRVISTEEELKVFNDPYRMKIIKTFQRAKKPLTVKGCADIMGEVPAKVHYHVKKLLKIEILELDHVEVINGINAKYYKLPKTSFTISLKESDQSNVLQRVAQVHNIISNIVDDFKEEFMKASSRAVENEIKDEHEVGTMSSTAVYLSKEEFEDISKYLLSLSEKYEEDGKERKRYTLLTGLAKKDE